MKYLNADAAVDIRAALLQSGQAFSPAWIDAGRVVVPAAEIPDLSDNEAGVRLLDAFRAAGHSELVCLSTEDLGADEPQQAVLADLGEVADWRWDLAPFDVLLTTADRSVAALLSVDEFVLIGGSPDFVESALGESIPAARAAFRAYAASTANASRHLPLLADRYDS
ncbi:hypothetical protein [Nocardia jiangxiensis]|uniref:Uncharacterized protein n=1 Tax=Nocardia jiangxiensis TaxID=282685 RepID=A0ABW6SFY2_9NOCA|nr:hypothetical protein [Nocardia jiangxiensis]